MILGIGTDIVEISRLENASGALLERAFTPDELAYAKKFRNFAEHLAGRWAAKEALSKALGCGMGELCQWQDIAVSNDQHGKPVMILSGVTGDSCRNIGGKVIHLSISHEKKYAIAFVIIEGEK